MDSSKASTFTRFTRKILAMFLAMLFVFASVAEISSFAVEAAEKISNPDRRFGIDGIDSNPNVGQHNSYVWSSELFRQTDGDYLWAGINRDLGVGVFGLTGMDPGLFHLLNIPEPTLDRAGRIYRQRASDPTAPWELMYASTAISGFRRMIVFDGDLYVIAGLTNRPIADYSIILRFPKDFRPGDSPDIVIWEQLLEVGTEYFRAATVLDDRLYIGTFDGQVFVTDGTGLQNLTPNSGDNLVGWSHAFNISDSGILTEEVIWDLLAFNGSIYAFTSGTDSVRGFRVIKITPGPDGYTFEHIVGGPQAQYPFGMGIHGNVAASGFLSTSFGQDYVYVSTFANGPAILIGLGRGAVDGVLRHLYTPAQIYRFGTDDVWEVVVGDRTGNRVAVDRLGQPVPHVGNHRAGFSPLPDYRKNTSFNQYGWWMAEHEGRMYATTWNMGNFREHYALIMALHIETLIEGASRVMYGYLDALNDLHYMLARDAHLIDFYAMGEAIDEHLYNNLAETYSETLTITNEVEPVDTSDDLVSEELLDVTELYVMFGADRREIVEGIVSIIADHSPSEDFRSAVVVLTDIIMEIIEETDGSELTARELAAHLVELYGFSADYFADVTSPLGFNMFVSEDGVNFDPITVNGFGDPNNYGGRVIVSSEHGLHVMTANPFTGGQVWRADQVRLNLQPNGPSELAIGRTATQAMTVLVTDSGTTNSRLQVSYDSDLVNVSLMRRPATTSSHFSWDNQVIFDAARNMPRYVVTETETIHESVVYDVMFTPLRSGRQDVTLHFELDGIVASRTVDLTVYFQGFADRSGLSAKISDVSELNRSDFTQETWIPFLMAYVDALTVYNNPAATQNQINRALDDLIRTYNALIPIQPPAGFRVINTEAQLRAMTRRGNYWLANDIELTRSWSPISRFEGTLDGNGRTISNLVVNNPRSINQGMFRRLDSGASVRDLNIQVGPAGIRGTNRVGALAGRADGATIIGVSIEAGNGGIVGSRYVGGLIGRASNSVIVGSLVYGHNGLSEIYLHHPEPSNVFAVRGTNRTRSSVGGLVGELNRTVVANSASYVNVTGYMGVGGFVGHMRSSAVSDSFARGYVYGRTRLVGRSYNNGERIGGFIGVSSGVGALIENVYSSGVVESNGRRRINPFIGQADGRLLTRGINFYDRDSARNSTVSVQNLNNITPTDVAGAARGGLLGESRHNLMSRETFTTLGANWDFESIWTVGIFHDTPFHTRTRPYFIAGIVLASRPPVVRTINLDDAEITGIGHSEDAVIRVELPDGTTLETATDSSLEWSVNIPRGVRLAEDDEVIVTQQEVGLPESTESVSYAQIERPIDICAQINAQSTTNNGGQNVIRYSITISNSGNEYERADRIHLTNALPANATFVPASVRLISENANGDEVITNIPRNTSGISVRGHSLNVANHNLEVRLGDFRLYGGEAVTLEFDVIINTNIAEAHIGATATNVTVGRVSRNSVYNIIEATALEEGFAIE
ncbi:MAG: hypothetical protein FWD05_09075 [Oscillospiraceae bacterium]|nr:hypothetical protein [Oscillospiraceae bacterium]